VVPGTTATSSPSPAPTTGGTTVAAGSAAQSATITGSGAIASLSVSVPATTSGTAAIAFALSAAAPGSVPAVSSIARKIPSAIGGTLAPIAYLTITPSATVTFASTLGLAFTLASGQTIPAGSNVFVGFYDPTKASAGWTTYLTSPAISGSTITFAPIGQIATLQANVAYVVALFSSAQVLAPQTTATTFPGGATLQVASLGPMPAAARSAVFTFTPSGGTPVTNIVSISPSCAAPCPVTLSAPLGVSLAVGVAVYSSTNGTGNALASGSGVASMFANEVTDQEYSLTGIMASFTVSVTPASLTQGYASSISVGVTALDSAGEPLPPYGAVSPTLAQPAFTATINGAGGTSTSYYSGLGTGNPVTVTVSTPGYPSVTSSPIPITAATQTAIGYAFGMVLPNGAAVPVGVHEYPAASGTPVRAYSPACSTCTGHPRFDPSGTLWGLYAVGITSSATAAGTFAPAGSLLTFDGSGNVYVSDPTTTAIDEYAGPQSTTLVRQITLPAPPGATAVDVAGNVYVGAANPFSGATANGIAEYPAGGSGTLMPIATNASFAFPATDAAGNVYGVAGSATSATVGVWPAGTFGSGPPARTITLTPSPAANADQYQVADMAVDAVGDVYVLEAVVTADFTQIQSLAIYYAPAGASTFASTPLLGGSTFNKGYIAAPLR
jgi:hypothetical protein